MGDLEQSGNDLTNTLISSKIYFISGLGADERVFQFIRLNSLTGIPIKWETPAPDESLSAYATRLIEQIDRQKKVILIGVSFGGIIAQEIARLIPCEKVIIISSIKSAKEMPWTLRLIKCTSLYQLFPPSVFKWLNLLTADYYFGTENKAESKLLQAIIKDTDNHFMKWAISRIMLWDNTVTNPALLHLHGTRDRIFPIGSIKNAVKIKGGGHFMIVNRANQISNLINEAIQEKL